MADPEFSGAGVPVPKKRGRKPIILPNFPEKWIKRWNRTKTRWRVPNLVILIRNWHRYTLYIIITVLVFEAKLTAQILSFSCCFRRKNGKNNGFARTRRELAPILWKILDPPLPMKTHPSTYRCLIPKVELASPEDSLFWVEVWEVFLNLKNIKRNFMLVMWWSFPVIHILDNVGRFVQLLMLSKRSEFNPWSRLWIILGNFILLNSSD